MSEITPLTKDQLFEKKIAENTGSDYNVGDISDVVPVTKDQALLKEIALNSAEQSGDITELEGKVADNAEAIEATQDMISDAYDSTHTYNVGDYCIYEDTLYKCNTASTTGTWDLTKWDAVTVADEVRELTERVDRGSVYVACDGVKTTQQVLNELYSMVDSSKISSKSRLAYVYDNNTYWFLSLSALTPNKFRFDGIIDSDTTIVVAYHVQLSSTVSDCSHIEDNITSGIQSVDKSTTVQPSVWGYRVYY